MSSRSLFNILQSNQAERTQQSEMHYQKLYLQNEEMLWAMIFNNTISDSSWLHNPSFSPGRAALGYPALYALYRILDEARPQTILEIGLGQSTHLISQYAAANLDVTHIVIEHDQSWIDFYSNNKTYIHPSNTSIMRLDLVIEAHNNAMVRKYKGFKEAFHGKKFDLICIDGPFGYDMKNYSRVDVLESMPNCLNDNFIIALDDCERSGEQTTLEEMEAVLTSCSIPYAKGIYRGVKDFTIICSNEQKFLCTM